MAKTLVNKQQQARNKAHSKNQSLAKSSAVEVQSQIPEKSKPACSQIHAVPKSADSNNISAEKLSGTADSQAPYSNPSKSGAVSSTARRQVFQRDQCCQYQDPKTGVQCGSRKFLSVDHIQPQFAGGNNDPQNLRIYCRSHNIHRYNAENLDRTAV